MDIPAPPPLPVARDMRQPPCKNVQEPAHPPFLTTGSTKEDKVFKFFDLSGPLASVSVRTVVRHYLGGSHLNNVPAPGIYMILGRLRCLHYAIGRYNAGLETPFPAFTEYWRPRVLNHLSGFGFQLHFAAHPIHVAGLSELIQTVEDIFSTEIREARECIKDGSITFEALGELYRHDTPVYSTEYLGGTPAVFYVVDSYYQEHRNITGVQKSFTWILEFVATMGSHVTVVSVTECLNAWSGVRARPLSHLAYVPLSRLEKSHLQERGESYTKYAAGGAKFLRYEGDSFFRHSRPSQQNNASLSGSAYNRLPSSGRVMIDVDRGALLGHHASQGLDEPTLAMIKLAERYRRWKNTSSKRGSSTDTLLLWETVPEEFQLYCWPALVGFSFSAKSWGHVLVSGLSHIEFNDKAFQELVLAEERKQLIRALVQYGNDHDIDDIVGGKQSGAIFLLHGPPGVGKTLTAEAVAELLRRPLYYVTMGELGLTPQEMEHRLSDVLDLCAEWNAITVLDEADVFLEQRSTSDLVRSSMVCVMLRLLEYHPGILFLTTNRVRSFDPAFESRVTVALRYESLDFEARIQIWENLLRRASLPISSEVILKKLGNHELNGRQIKGVVRLACALAKERSAPALTQDILDTTLQFTSTGREGMANDHSWQP